MTRFLNVVLICVIASASSLALAASGKTLADVHKAMNIPCESCHGANNAVPEPGIKECSRCHDPAKLAEKTEPSDPTKHNPHRSPHYGIQLDCVNCHHGHEESEDYCAQCHNFGFKVP